MRATILSIIALALLGGCSSKSENDGNIPQVASNVPRTADYVGDETPRAIVPAGQDIPEMAIPLEQEGTDTGQDGITYAAVLAGYYLMRVQLDSGRFNYQYNLGDDTWAEDDSIHRQCGSTITQAYLYRVTRREEFKVSARRALDYLHGQTSVQQDGSLDLAGMGATALLSIATSVYTIHSGDDEYADELELLGQNLLTYIDPETGGFSSGDSIFLAQGQVMMALEHVHAATGNVEYLDALERTARWAIANPDAHKWGPYFGLWANEPLTYLFSLRPDDELAEAAYAMADPIVDGQHIPGESEKKSWEGGYPLDSETINPSWSTCLRLEAVIDGYRMALLHGDTERQERYGQSAQWASAYLMRLQFRVGETDDHPDPGLLIGAVPFNFGGTAIRVDVAHHVAQSLLKTAEYLDLEDSPGARSPDDVSP